MDHREYLAKIGRRGGLATAATHDMRKVAAHARKSAPSNLDYWRELVTEEFGELDASDRDARARSRQKLYFSDIGRKSAKARSKKAVDATNGAPTPKGAAAKTASDTPDAVRAV